MTAPARRRRKKRNEPAKIVITFHDGATLEEVSATLAAMNTILTTIEKEMTGNNEIEWVVSATKTGAKK